MRLHCTLLLICFWATVAGAQPKVNATSKEPVKAPDSTGAVRPTSLTFTASTDQRFFFFGDTRNEDNRRVPVNVYGVQAGFLFPIRKPRPALQGRPAGFRAGVGFFFTNQTLDEPGLLPNTFVPVTRRLRYATLNYEPFVFRRRTFEISIPMEIGVGWSRYERAGSPREEPDLVRGTFVPAGVGLGLSYMFPHPRWFRPLSWFGVNLLVGRRFTLKRDVPESRINYSGWYVSVGPAFFLENFTADYKRWRQRRKRGK